LEFLVLAPVAFAASALFVPAIAAGTRDWLRFGSIDWNEGKRIALVVAVMYVIMLGGVVLFHFDMTHQPLIRSGLPSIALVFVGIAIAAVNAGAEEFVYRGLVMQSLDEGIGAGWPSLILQAVAFGTFHFNSTEPGLTGIAGAALFGLLLGWLRRSSRGMLAPYVAHILVDLLIWTIKPRSTQSSSLNALFQNKPKRSAWERRGLSATRLELVRGRHLVSLALAHPAASCPWRGGPGGEAFRRCMEVRGGIA
jgi:membrane protease YdiL (CAAX protease family)